MEPVTRIEGVVCPLDRADVDTDQIIPKQFLKRIERTGFGEFLFWDWRGEEGFPLDRPEYAGAPILVAGRNFGCGSSREHAPQAIQKYGFKAIIAESYAEIFFGNSTTLGMPCVTAAREDIARIAAAVDRNPQTEVTIDLANLEVRFGGQTAKITQRESARDALVNGRWDAIGELLDGVPAVKDTAKKLPYLAAAS